jgi:4-alpha-glucanotransferase
VQRYIATPDDVTRAAPPRFTGEINEGIIRALLASPSRFTIFPMQDLFGWHDRINTPATVDEDNWSWRLRWYVDELETLDEPRERAALLKDWTREAGR